MYSMPGYDRWKTSPPEEPKPVLECEYCGCEFHKGDECVEINGEILCVTCALEAYRKIV